MKGFNFVGIQRANVLHRQTVFLHRTGDLNFNVYKTERWDGLEYHLVLSAQREDLEDKSGGVYCYGVNFCLGSVLQFYLTCVLLNDWGKQKIEK